MSKEKTLFWVVVEDREELQDHTAETELEWPAFGFRKILIQVLKVCRFPVAAVSTLGKQPVIEGLQDAVRHAPAEIEEGFAKAAQRLGNARSFFGRAIKERVSWMQASKTRSCSCAWIQGPRRILHENSSLQSPLKAAWLQLNGGQHVCIGRFVRGRARSRLLRAA